jgi:hypothetical protein
LGLQYAIEKGNWVLDRVQIKDSEPKVQTQVPRGKEVDQDFPRRDFPFHPRASTHHDLMPIDLLSFDVL